MKTALLITAFTALAQPATAQVRTPYKALGTEPFWSLNIDRNTITYRGVEGRPLTVSKPRPIIGRDGETYRTRGMTVAITHRRCSDGMSDRTYADTVRVTIGRRTLNGCGGAVVADQPPGGSLLANTRWRIELVDGRPVRLDRPATVNFTRDRIEGKICNGFGGQYRFARGTLTTREVISTQMACAGQLGATESAFHRLISQPVRVSQGNRDTLVLTSGRLSVTLRRLR